ncbi:MAG: WecB/TagA/CpsF family glycosyltransferase [Clostridia bacterium]|nr:WecB/TagA/CpsF family glycosyltransferase [Clostridia bacterium]
MSKLSILKIPYDNVTMSEALCLASDALGKDGVTAVVTPNAEIAYLCLKDEQILETICDADIILPDGAGVILASELIGTPLREKVAGVEFGEALLRLAAKRGKSVYLLGGKPSVADLASEKLRAKYPALHICGTHDGYFDKEGAENDAVIDAVNRSGAEILLVCFGAPAQEIWLRNNRERLTAVRLAACLGGSLDIYAGTAKRAPDIFIKLRLEWLARLIQSPSRLPRMMRLPKYIFAAVKERRKRKGDP